MLMQKVQEKLQRLSINKSRRIKFHSGVRADCPPSSQRASFPFPSHTPFCRPLSHRQALKELGFTDPDGAGHVDDSAAPFNEPCNVSGSPHGPCIVTRTLHMSNSHAGTHADQPTHFIELSGDEKDTVFDDRQYNGHCLIVDLSAELLNNDSDSDDDSASYRITREMLMRVFHPIVSGTSRIAVDSIGRLLFCTWTNVQTEDAIDESQWTDKFAYFDPMGAGWLVETFPNLLLVGIDTPSVDHPSASPICNHSHGALWNGRVAILENLRFHRFFNYEGDDRRSDLLSLDNNDRSMFEAHLQTIWSPTQIYDDAKGCSVMLYLYDEL